jgi:hypothetical protein
MHYRSRGVTLFELLLSLTISTFILATLIKLYFTAHENLLLQNDSGTLQNNSQQAIQLLKYDIHQAGYIGCAHLTKDFPVSNHTDIEYTFSNKISGTADSITLRYMNPATTALTGFMPDLNTIFIYRDEAYHIGDIVMVSDCNSAEIFRIQAIKISAHFQTLIPATPLTKIFGPDAELAKLECKTYFCRSTGRHKLNGQPVNSLYILSLAQRRPNEITEGVDAIKFRYDKTPESISGIKMTLQLSGMRLQKTWYAYAAAP